MNKKNKIIVTTVLIISLFALQTFSKVHANFDQKEWKYLKDIVNYDVDFPYTKIILDDQIYTNTTYKDLRILNSSGVEVPYKLFEENEIKRTESIPANVIDSSTLNGKSMAIIDTNNSNVVHSSVELNLGGNSFKKRVQIYASDNRLGHSDYGWRLILQDGYVFGFYDQVTGFKAVNNVVNYPKTTSRYLRVVLSDGEGDLPTINNSFVSKNILNTAKIESQKYPLSIINNLSDKITELLLDLGKSGLPINKVQLSTADKNWNRHAVVQASESKDGPWRVMGEDYLYSIDQTLYKGKNLSIPFPESYQRYIKIVVANYDNSPVKFDSEAEVYRNQRSIIFKTSDIPVKLYYGNPKATAPRYDFEKIFSYADEKSIASADLGKQENNVNYEGPKAPEKTFSEKYPQALNVILVLLVICLGGFMFFVIKKSKDNK